MRITHIKVSEAEIESAIVNTCITFTRRTPRDPKPEQGEPILYESDNNLVFNAAPWLGANTFDVSDYGGASCTIELDNEAAKLLNDKFDAALEPEAFDPYEHDSVYGLAANR